MPLTNAGRDQITQSIKGETVTPFDATNAYLGVGDSTTVFAATQTDLQAATNKQRKAMDASFPTRSGNQLTYQTTFGTGDANFNWNEWGLFNNSSGGTMLVRKVETIGSGAKPNTETWILSVTLTVTAT